MLKTEVCIMFKALGIAYVMENNPETVSLVSYNQLHFQTIHTLKCPTIRPSQSSAFYIPYIPSK